MDGPTGFDFSFLFGTGFGRVGMEKNLNCFLVGIWIGGHSRFYPCMNFGKIFIAGCPHSYS